MLNVILKTASKWNYWFIIYWFIGLIVSRAANQEKVLISFFWAQIEGKCNGWFNSKDLLALVKFFFPEAALD